MSDQEVILVAIVKAAEGKYDRMNQLTTEYHQAFYDKEPGTLQFQWHEEEESGEGRICLYERYTTRADLDKHRADPLHAKLFQTFSEENILAEAPVVFVGKAIGGHRERS